MTLTRWQKPVAWQWSPLQQLSTLQEEIDRLFGSSFSVFPEQQSSSTGWVPALDLFEDQDHVYLKAEVPGVNKDDLQISLHEGTLTLSGERKEVKPAEGVAVLRTERFTGKFSRSMTLPAPIQEDKVTASCRDGILKVVLPKAEASKPKKIQVQGE